MMRIRQVIEWFGVFCTLALVCGETAAAEPEWWRGRPIYEVDLARQTEAGTLAAFTEERLVALEELGVKILWFMPVHPKGNFSRYNVLDHFELDPAFGTKEEFKAMVEAAHGRGMAVILDWVGNHTSMKHRFLKERPGWFHWNADGTPRHVAPWKDIAQLNWENREVWEYMFEARKYWVESFGVDGFREDVADRVPLEHWKWLRPKLDALREGGVFMLAEGHGERLAEAFDATYDWELPAVFWKVANGRGGLSAGAFEDFVRKEEQHWAEGMLRMRHLTNHDVHGKGHAWPTRGYIDPGYLESTGLVERSGGLAGTRVFNVLGATLPKSVPMAWTGQELGIYEKTPKVVKDWTENEETRFLKRLWGVFVKEEGLWGNEVMGEVSEGGKRVLGFSRGEEAGLVVLANVGGEAERVMVMSGAGGEYEVLVATGGLRRAGEKVELAGEIELAGWEALVLKRIR